MWQYKAIVVLLVVFAAVQIAFATFPSCPPPNGPKNGGFSPQQYQYPVGHTIKFFCNKGFVLKGAPWTICIFNVWKRKALWHADPPECKPKVINCPELENPSNGIVRFSGTIPGSRADYKCNTGFKLEGVAWRKCQANGQWTGEAPTCKKIQCPGLDNPRNGVVRVGGTTPGSRADYKCNTGFKLEGVAWRKCQANGQWTGEAPTCKKIQCPGLDNPRNGVVRVGGTTPGSTAQYKCNDGFQLVGVARRVCQPDGEWSGREPTCKQIQCPDLDNPRNGVVRVGGTTPGSKADYKCNTGFKLEGVAWRKCQANGQWTGKAPTCKKIQCPGLDNPKNGVVRVGGTTPGSTAQYKCNDGFQLVGVARRVCQPNGEWSGRKPTCKQIQCPDLDNPRNGVVRVGGTTPGSKADYKCNTGFKLEGVAWRKCQANGQWTGEAPTCKKIQCPGLDNPKNGVVRVGGTTPGSTAQYKCNDGFQLVGVARRVCQPDGEWSGREPTCKQIQCPDLDNPRNGVVRVGGTTPGSKADYKCNTGFNLEGVAWRKCQANGQWTGEAPTCKKIQCPGLDNPRNGVVRVGGTTPGSTAQYKCNDGFQLVGVARRVCQPNGEWSGREPTCKQIQCPGLDNPRNGVVRVGSTTPGSTAQYKCNDGFQLVGVARRVCQPNGEWSGREPTCKQIQCPGLDNPRNGVVRVGSTTPGSTAQYKCNDGFQLVGEARRVCQPDGEWSGREPTCKQIQCPGLDNPRNGVVRVGGTTPGSTAQYKCNDGFQLVGVARRVCQPNGEWSGREPTCKQIQCPDLDNPRNGVVRVGGTTPGSKADYKCNTGFKLEGVAWRKCQANGQWTGEAPTCKKIQCPGLDNPKNGVVRVGGTTPGSTAQYKCNDGFQLVGVARRVCQPNGEWSGREPTCKQIQCPGLDNPRNGVVRVGGTTPGSTAQYKCNDGFQLVGVARRVCQPDGEWSGREPTCKQIQCPDLDNPRNGVVRVGGTTPGSKADYKCNTGFKLEGVAWRKCQANGQWTGEAPTCKRIQCPNLENPSNGVVRVGGTTPGSKADYKCNTGFKLEGVAWRKCQANGQWTGKAPTCKRKRVECPDLDNPRYGSVRVSGTTPGSRADYKCNTGFKLDGVAWRKCQDNGQWTGEAPTCKRVDCGRLRNPDNGSVKFKSTTFGSKAVYSCNHGFVLTKGDKKRKCQANGHWSGRMPVCKKH